MWVFNLLFVQEKKAGAGNGLYFLVSISWPFLPFFISLSEISYSATEPGGMEITFELMWMEKIW